MCKCFCLLANTAGTCPFLGAVHAASGRIPALHTLPALAQLLEDVEEELREQGAKDVEGPRGRTVAGVVYVNSMQRHGVACNWERRKILSIHTHTSCIRLTYACLVLVSLCFM